MTEPCPDFLGNVPNVDQVSERIKKFSMQQFEMGAYIFYPAVK